MNQSEHDILVAQLVSHLESKGFDKIKADIRGYIQPSRFWWKNNPDEKFKPDVTAEDSSGVYYIFEVETSDTITGEHSENQWKLFSAHAKKNNGVFVIYVESGSEDNAKAQTAFLGIDATVW